MQPQSAFPAPSGAPLVMPDAGVEPGFAVDDEDTTLMRVGGPLGVACGVASTAAVAVVAEGATEGSLEDSDEDEPEAPPAAEGSSRARRSGFSASSFSNSSLKWACGAC